MGVNNYLQNIPVKHDFVTVFLTVISLFVQFMVFLFVFRWYNNYIIVRNQKMNFRKQFRKYMAYHEIPPGLRDRMLSYFNFKYGDNFYDDNTVYSVLPIGLKNDIKSDLCDKFLKKIYLYETLPRRALELIAHHLIMQFFLPGDHIVEYGDVGASMYLIYVGSVAVYSKDHIEICHLNEGDYFGEFALVLDIPRTANVVAITFCKILKLSREKFCLALEGFPEIKNQMERALLQQLQIIKGQ
ncbi:cGMP-dependent protein kinase-like [Aethina tumida]|uniref:cGMP-dependent protein kinase-like n=1 Tax=Aethina tumida TaxID=116153 RepID=UPI002147A281|nr:cGMP-dependent protein kinase-like [Aethina tumida]